MTALQALFLVSLLLLNARELVVCLQRRARRLRVRVLDHLAEQGPTPTLDLNRKLGMRIYGALHDLHDAELVTYEVESRDPEGLPRHRYRLTDLGARVVAAGLHRRLS